MSQIRVLDFRLNQMKDQIGSEIRLEQSRLELREQINFFFRFQILRLDERLDWIRLDDMRLEISLDQIGVDKIRADWSGEQRSDQSCQIRVDQRLAQMRCDEIR